MANHFHTKTKFKCCNKIDEMWLECIVIFNQEEMLSDFHKNLGKRKEEFFSFIFLMTTNIIELSRGEICVANFIPACEWSESRQQILANNSTPLCYSKKIRYSAIFWVRIPSQMGGHNSPFYFTTPDIIEVKIHHRQTDGQTDKCFDTIYGCMLIFSLE